MVSRRSLRAPSQCRESSAVSFRTAPPSPLGAQRVEAVDDRERVGALARAQVVLGEAPELGRFGAQFLALLARVRLGEEAGERRVGGRLARALGEQGGQRVLVLGRLVAGADEFEQLDGERAQDGDLDLVERDGRAAAGQRLEAAHGPAISRGPG